MVLPVGSWSKSNINKLEHRRAVKIRTPAMIARKKIGKRDIDLSQVYQLARIMCSQKEIGAILGIGEHGVNTFVETWPDFAEALDKGYTETKQSLRKTQLDLALNGHSSMLMWLGKQYLGQADQHKIENKTEINVTVQRAMDELRNIPKDKLLEAMAIIDAPVINND